MQAAATAVVLLFYLYASLFRPIEKDRWNIKNFDGRTYEDCTSLELEGDSLSFCISDRDNKIPVAPIIELQKVRKSRFWRGSAVGFLIGASAGSLVGYLSHDALKDESGGWDFDFGPGLSALGGGAAGGLLGFITGGLTGAMAGRDEVYPLINLRYKQKLAFIENLIKEL